MDHSYDLSYCQKGLASLFERAHVSSRHQDLQNIVYYCLSPIAPVEETLELAKQYKNKDVFVNLLYEKALLLHAGEHSLTLDYREFCKNLTASGTDTVNSFSCNKDHLFHVLNLLWTNDIQPPLSFWSPISRSLQSRYYTVFSTKKIDEDFFKSTLSFFKNKNLPPMIGAIPLSSSIDVINHVLKIPANKPKTASHSNLHTSNFSHHTYLALINQMDFGAIALNNRMAIANLFNNKIKDEPQTGFSLVKQFCGQKNIDLLVLSKRIFNLGSSEEILSCASLLRACAEEYGEKCLTPSRRFVLHEKHKDFLNKHLNEHGLWQGASSQDISGILNYLASHEIRANIKDALQSKPTPTKLRKM